MDKFIKKNIFQRMKMSISELEDYYKNLRRYQFEQRQPLKGIQLRKYTLGLYAMLLKLDRILSHEKISLLKNESVKTKRPVVFAVTHVGGFDVARVYELIRPKAYMLFGDPSDIYKSPYGLLAFSIGWIPLDTSDSAERKIATLRAEELLSAQAPAEYRDRATLWNAVEKAERGKKAQLAYSFDIALQNEFSMEENIALARQFVSEQLVDQGMIADFAIHQPDREDGGIPNPHFHILCPIRPIEPDGKWGCKQRRVYRLDENGNRIIGEDGKPLFDAVPTTDWGKPETLEQWQETWTAMVNAKFEEKELSCRIDYRSYERQGLDTLPTVHEGVAVRQMEAKGVVTDKVLHSATKYLSICFVIVAAALGVFACLPHQSMSVILGMAITLSISALLFSMRAIFFAPMDEVKVPREITGSAMSIGSFVGYLPGAFMYVIYGGILDKVPGVAGYRIVFLVMAGFAVIGCLLSLYILKVIKKQRAVA